MKHRRTIMGLLALGLLAGCGKTSSLGRQDDNANLAGAGGAGMGEGGHGIGEGGASQAGTVGMGGWSEGGAIGMGGWGQAGTIGMGGWSEGGSSGWSPCGDLPCGAPCTTCPPGAMDCAAPAVEMYCSATGECGMPYPECGGGAACNSRLDCPDIDAECETCADGTFACPDYECQNGACALVYQACESSCASTQDCPQLGAPCEVCSDGSTVCPEVACVDGQCLGTFPSCTGPVDPACANKACGDSCHPCDGIPGCLGPPVTMYCDANSQCQAGGSPVCDSWGSCQADSDCPAIELCSACPDGTCAEMRCLMGACGLSCE